MVELESWVVLKWCRQTYRRNIHGVLCVGGSVWPSSMALWLRQMFECLRQIWVPAFAPIAEMSNAAFGVLDPPSCGRDRFEHAGRGRLSVRRQTMARLSNIGWQGVENDFHARISCNLSLPDLLSLRLKNM